MLKQAQNLTDPQARIAKFQQIQDYILSQAPYATVYSPTQTTMCSTIAGRVLPASGVPARPGELLEEVAVLLRRGGKGALT